jgi:hypothetical protein
VSGSGTAAPLPWWRPYPPYLRRVLRDALLVWVALNGVGAVVGELPETFAAALVSPAACALAVWFDLRRRGEHVFYANLGISPLLGPLLALAIGGALQLLLHRVV